MTRRAQPIIYVRADRNRVVVERAGAAPWKFPADEALAAIRRQAVRRAARHRARRGRVISGPFVIKIRRELSAYLVIAGAHGWLHGSLRAALADARDIARGFGALVVLEGRS